MKTSSFVTVLALMLTLIYLGNVNFWISLLVVSPYFLLPFNKTKIQLCSHIILIRLTLILYSFLFVARYLVTTLFPFDGFFGRVNLTSDGVTYSMMLSSFFTNFFLLGVLILHKPESPACKINFGNLNKEYKWLNTYANMGSAISLISFVFFLLANGNIVILINELITHDKLNYNFTPLSSLGLSIWAIFSSISVSLAIHISLVQKTYKKLPYILLILLGYVFVFGSRLDLFTIILLVYMLQTFSGNRISNFTKVVTFSTSMLLSIYVIYLRLQGNISGIRIYSLITYPILDASQVVISQPKQSFVSLFTVERFSQYLESFIPRFIVLNKTSIQKSRLDTIFADTLGTEMQRGRSGWPTGAFTELYLLGGWLFVALSALIAGVFIARILTHYAKPRNSESGANVIIFLVILLFCIAWFKDGDFFSSIQGSIRLLVYSLVASKFIDFIRLNREQLK